MHPDSGAELQPTPQVPCTSLYPGDGEKDTFAFPPGLVLSHVSGLYLEMLPFSNFSYPAKILFLNLLKGAVYGSHNLLADFVAPPWYTK